MPYKSKAQQGKFHAMAERGEISKKTVEKWDKETKGKYKQLPEKVKKRASIYLQTKKEAGIISSPASAFIDMWKAQSELIPKQISGFARERHVSKLQNVAKKVGPELRELYHEKVLPHEEYLRSLHGEHYKATPEYQQLMQDYKTSEKYQKLKNKLRDIKSRGETVVGATGRLEKPLETALKIGVPAVGAIGATAGAIATLPAIASTGKYLATGAPMKKFIAPFAVAKFGPEVSRITGLDQLISQRSLNKLVAQFAKEPVEKKGSLYPGYVSIDGTGIEIYNYQAKEATLGEVAEETSRLFTEAASQKELEKFNDKIRKYYKMKKPKPEHAAEIIEDAVGGSVPTKEVSTSIDALKAHIHSHGPAIREEASGIIDEAISKIHDELQRDRVKDLAISGAIGFGGNLAANLISGAIQPPEPRNKRANIEKAQRAIEDLMKKGHPIASILGATQNIVEKYPYASTFAIGAGVGYPIISSVANRRRYGYY